MDDHHDAANAVTDEDLVMRSRSGCEEATDTLLSRYKPLVLRLSRARFLAGGERDDLIQEGMIGLYKAIRDYEVSAGASFFTFASLCIDRQMLHAIESSQREKNRPLNNSVYLEDDGAVLSDSHLWESPESIVINRETADEHIEELKRVLSPMEREVLDLFLKGLGYREIAARMNKPPKAIDNALQRIRKKSEAAGGR